jgi:hypothetical protein
MAVRTQIREQITSLETAIHSYEIQNGREPSCITCLLATYNAGLFSPSDHVSVTDSEMDSDTDNDMDDRVYALEA